MGPSLKPPETPDTRPMPAIAVGAGARGGSAMLDRPPECGVVWHDSPEKNIFSEISQNQALFLRFPEYSGLDRFNHVSLSLLAYDDLGL